MASSLDILRPSPCPTNELSSVGPLAKDLENKSRILIQKDWSHPDIQQNIQSSWPPEQPWNTSIRNQQSLLHHIDAFELEIVSVSAEVKEDEGRASVSMLIALPEDENGLGRETIAVLHWKLMGGLWKCYEQTASFGIPSFGI